MNNDKTLEELKQELRDLEQAREISDIRNRIDEIKNAKWWQWYESKGDPWFLFIGFAIGVVFVAIMLQAKTKSNTEKTEQTEQIDNRVK